MLMFVTPVASGIHVGSIFSGLGSMIETYGEGFEIKLYFERRKKVDLLDECSESFSNKIIFIEKKNQTSFDDCETSVLRPVQKKD